MEKTGWKVEGYMAELKNLLNHSFCTLFYGLLMARL
jgi:hypothetical protein